MMANDGQNNGIGKSCIAFELADPKEAYDHLKYYDGVVLVEKLDKSNCVLIKKEIEQIETAGKKVVGNLLVR